MGQTNQWDYIRRSWFIFNLGAQYKDYVINYKIFLRDKRIKNISQRNMVRRPDGGVDGGEQIKASKPGHRGEQRYIKQ